MKLPLREYWGLLPVKILTGLARGAWWSLYPYSAYWRRGGAEPHMESALRQYAARPGNICWDIGAHYGIYSIGLALAIGAQGQVEAFEPDPVSFRRLRWHCRLNRLGNVHTHPVAASAITSAARLYQYEGFGSTSSHLPYLNETTTGVPSHEITTVALDEWVESGRIKPPHFIKIDVEGHAGAALSGMRRTLSAAQPVVILAIHTSDEHHAARAHLESLGYSLRALDQSKESEVMASHYGELLCLPVSRV